MKAVGRKRRSTATADVQRARIAAVLALDRKMSSENNVFDLEDGEEVSCLHCIALCCYTTYKKGEAFLAGPRHTPYDGNANHVCRKHLDSDAVVPEHPKSLSEPPSMV